METRFKKAFLKQLAELPAGIRGRIEEFVFNELPEIDTLAESGKIEMMRGYRGFYKARFGDYRVGLSVAESVVTVRVVMHRKEVYRFFP